MKGSIQKNLRDYPGWATILLTAVGYSLVLGTLYSDTFSFLYPRIGLETVNLLSHLIAANNTLAVVALGLGWFWIRRGDVRKHPIAMVSAFVLILVFLILYLVKTGGGGRKEFLGPPVAWWVYVVMLGVHILLSMISVPVVLYTLLLGATRSIEEVRTTVHARVGRLAAGAWVLSLILGVIAYVLLNHVYSFTFVPA